MTKNLPYPEELKIEAVKQLTERGHKVAEISARIGLSQHNLYKWIKAYAAPAAERQVQASQAEVLLRLKTELRRVTEESDILKKGPPRTLPSSPGEVRVHLGVRGPLQRASHVQGGASTAGGHYAWKVEPQSLRAKDGQRLTGLLKQAWLASKGVYGYRKLTLDMRDLGER